MITPETYWIVAVVIAVAVIVLVLWTRRANAGRIEQDRHHIDPRARTEPLPLPPAGVGHPPDLADAVPQKKPNITPAAGPPDDLARLKGVGPKLVAMLNGLGVTRYDQVAAWSDTDLDAIDSQLGNFRGRARRDLWVEQAKLLAAGDTVGFEARFGKLGG